MGKKINYIYGKRRNGDIESIFASNEKANKFLGWKPEKSIDDIFLSALAWEKNKGRIFVK